MFGSNFAARPKPAQLGVLLFALPLLVYLLSGPVFFGYDGEMMYRVSESLVVRHSLQVTDPIYHFAQPWSPYGIGTSIMLLPFVAVGELLLHDPRAFVMVYLPLVTALTVVAVNRLLVELGVSWTRAAWLSLVFAFGTIAWHYSGVLFSEPLVGLTITTSLLWLLWFRRTGQLRWLALAGLMGGLALLARADSALLVLPPLGVYALFLISRARPGWRRWAIEALAYAGPIAAMGLLSIGYDIVRYGAPLRGPYSTDAIGFAEPLLSGLYGLLLSPGVGLIVFTPVVAMGVVGFPAFVRRWRWEALVIAALVFVRVLFYARWWDWSGGATWGPRFLVPLIPLLIVPVAFVSGRRWQVVVAGLAVLGVGVEVLVQLVPYGLVYGAEVPQLASSMGVCHCVPGPSRTTWAIHEVMAFDLRYAPLGWQLRLLASGVIAPAWGPIAFVLVPLVGAAGFALVRIGAVARGLDRVRVPAPTLTLPQIGGGN